MIIKPLLIIALLAFPFSTKLITGEDVIKLMHKKYAGKWARTLVFDQTTEIYRDTSKKVQNWYEWMQFPDKLRIDVEPTSAGNTRIFRGDSTYSFVNGKLQSASPQGNDLIFLLGGMYFSPLAQTIEKIKAQGYDLNKLSKDTWKGKAIYIIGATCKDDKTSQLWVNKDDLYLVRIIKYDKGTKQDALFEDYIKIGGGGAETKVEFYLDDKLRQVEVYHHCREVPDMDMKIFDHQHYEQVSYK